MTTRDIKLHESDAALERLLEEASPRPAPSAEAAARARLAVHEEWQDLVGRRTRRRRTGFLAAAAAAVLAIALAVNQVPAPEPVLTATVDKAIGSIYLLADDSTLTELSTPAEFMTDQTVVTGENAALGLAWSAGGSLRLDESTELRFVSTDRVELVSGRLYFDSQDPPDGATRLTVETAHGDVTHIGTQFIVEAKPERLTVSVRDGSVAIVGHRYSETGYAGKAITLRGDSRPEHLDVRVYGQYWEWIEATAPGVDPEGKTLAALLSWVQRETGLEIRFEDAQLRDEVLDVEFTGVSDISNVPREALSQFLRGYGLDYEIREGVIHIREFGSP